MKVSICICTYRRPKQLASLLKCLSEHKNDNLYPMEVIVIDNDKYKSAAPVVKEVRKILPYKIKYYIEPIQNISLARNKAILCSSGDLVCFIDDDEYPERNWLRNLVIYYQNNKCDGVLGPVEPKYEITPPKWIVKSKIYNRPNPQSGTKIGQKDMRTGNFLVNRKILVDSNNYFDPKFGLVGGEDVDFFRRMVSKDYKFLWCKEAIVYEFISKERLTLRYQIKRALSRGKSHSMMTSFISMGTLKSIIAIIMYTLILPFFLIVGLHLFNKYLIKLCDHVGKILGYLGINPVQQYKD